jgi:hypothetical protein
MKTKGTKILGNVKTDYINMLEPLERVVAKYKY